MSEEELKLSHPVEGEGRKARSKSIVREYLEAIVIALLLALFIRAFVVQAFKIPSGSMKETLLVGDHILVNKFIYGIKIPFQEKEMIDFGDPRRKDIIVFIYPQDPSKDFIKRVVGGPGDTVEIVDKQVYVNGKPLDEPYKQHTDPRIIPGRINPRDNMAPLKVPPGKLFVMGDNRDESYDSRFWGTVDISKVKGKAFIIYWSWNKESSGVRWGRIGDLVH